MEELEAQNQSVLESLTEFTVKQGNELTDDICRRFSLVLSSVEELNHQSIQYALYTEIKDSFQYVRDQITPRYGMARETLAAEAANILARNEVNICSSKEICNFWNEISCPDFRWYVSPLPQSQDYAACEVMDSIREGVRRSVDTYIRQAREYAKHLDNGSKMLCEMVKERQAGAIDREAKIHAEKLESAVSAWNENRLQAQAIARKADETLESFYRQLGVK